MGLFGNFQANVENMETQDILNYRAIVTYKERQNPVYRIGNNYSDKRYKWHRNRFCDYCA
jgi:hypothetical protein